MQNEILLKIKKLLDLSKNNTNVHEAAAAYHAAQKLLTQHRLSLVDLEKADDSDYDFDDVYYGKRKITWKGVLASGIAKCNGCRAFWRATRAGRVLQVVGKKANIDIVKWLYASVSAQIESLCKLAVQASYGGKTFSNNFKLGASNAVIQRLQLAKSEVESEYTGTHALVHINQADAKLEQYFREVLEVKPYTAKFTGDSNGYAAGTRAGKRVNITKGGLPNKSVAGLIGK